MKSNIIFSLISLSLVFFSCAGTKTVAQTPDNTQDMNLEQMAEQQTAQMAEQLKLTTKQNIEVKAINLKYAEKLQIIRQQPRSRSKMKAFKNTIKKKNEEMKTILTRKQYADYEKILKERKDKMKKRRG